MHMPILTCTYISQRHKGYSTLLPSTDYPQVRHLIHTVTVSPSLTDTIQNAQAARSTLIYQIYQEQLVLRQTNFMALKAHELDGLRPAEPSSHMMYQYARKIII